MVITVDELLNKPFLNRPRSEKILIVQDDKPRPNLPFLTARGKDEDFTAFDTSSYDSVDWLTGCSARQALFCWPCLLFRIAKDAWNKNGVMDMNDLNAKIKTHARSISHIQSSLDLKLFLPRVKTTEEDPVVIGKTTDVIKRNREIASRVIDAVCLVVSEQHQSALRKIRYLNVEDCIKNLQVIRDYDIVKTGVIDDAIEMLKTSPKLVSDMVEAITSVMKASIQEDLYQSTFVSLILSEHPQVSERSRISVVLRYLKNGEVCERFVEFFSMEGERTCNSICKHVNKVIVDYNISHNMLAYSLDGYVFLDLDIFNQYVNFVRSNEDILHFCHPYISFVPCHFHKFDYVLRQSLSAIRECDAFFKSLELLLSCFQKGSKMVEEYLNYLATTGETSCLDIFKSTDNWKVFACVKVSRICFIRFFEQSSQFPENKTEDDLATIGGLCAFLKSFITIFLLEVFSKSFSLMSPLLEALYGKDSEETLDPTLVEKVYRAVVNEEKNGENIQNEKTFTNLFESAIKSFEEEIVEEKNKSVYRALYLNIIRCIDNQMKYRFLNDQKVVFYNILNFKKTGCRLNKSYVKKLALAYGSCFNYANLENEMASLENDEEILPCESAHQMIKVLLKSNLHHSCPNFYKLLELLLTLPCSLPSLNGGPSKLEYLTAWSSRPYAAENLGDVSLMGIECEHLKEIRKKFSFHDDVMTRFQNKTEVLQLTKI